MKKIAITALVSITLVSTAIAHEPDTTENETLRAQAEVKMLTMLIRLMELNMKNLDEEIAQCTANRPSTP